MNKLEIIRELKDKPNVKAFGQYSVEVRLIYEKAGLENCLVLNRDKAWRTPLAGFAWDCTYAIKPDWEPESKYATRKVYSNNRAWAVIDIPDVGLSYSIIVAAAHKDFITYFWLTENHAIVEISPFKVVNLMNKGKEVFGTFRREESKAD